MLLNGEAGVCVNGFPTHVSALFERTLDILQNEPELDFLKLSFTEHFGDHRFNWAYYNLDREQQRRYFPNGHETHVTAIRSRSGLAYTVGEIYYSNWPMLVSRRGNETLFLQDADVDPREPYLMVRALELARAGTLRSAVLLASPITHYRAEPYAGIERRE